MVQQHAAATPELQTQLAANLRLYCPSDRLLTTSIVEDQVNPLRMQAGYLLCGSLRCQSIIDAMLLGYNQMAHAGRGDAQTL